MCAATNHDANYLLDPGTSEKNEEDVQLKSWEPAVITSEYHRG